MLRGPLGIRRHTEIMDVRPPLIYPTQPTIWRAEALGLNTIRACS
jgi:hypothetical protein